LNWTCKRGEQTEMATRIAKKSVRQTGRAKKPAPERQESSNNTTPRMRTGTRKGSKKVMRKVGKSPIIHCMLAPTEEESLLLPTGVMAEVIDFLEPSPMEGSPPWLLGQIEWNKRQVPVFSFSALINGEDVAGSTNKAKILIIKSLSDTARVPYLGILLSDLPRMLNIKESNLVQTGDEKKSLGVFSRIMLDDQAAIVPDIDRLTHLVTHATFGALPITQLDP
jgi:chemosensory pili system protein ChpC